MSTGELIEALADTMHSPEAFDAALAELLAHQVDDVAAVAPSTPHQTCSRCAMTKPETEYRAGRRTCKTCETEQAGQRRRPDRIAGLVRRLADLEAQADAVTAADELAETLAAHYTIEHARGLQTTRKVHGHIEALADELERCAADGTVIGPELAAAAAKLLARIRSHHQNHAARANFRTAAHPLRTCRSCGDTKPLDQYGVDNKRRDKRRTACRDCERDRMRRQRQTAG